MKKYIIFVFILVLVFFPILSYAAEFNPNMIITDTDMTNYQSMTQNDIQSFLESQESALSLYRFVDLDRIQKTASEIIFNAAQRYFINPRVILVLIQKEQGLINNSSPSIEQLDWASGYGICDDCSKSDPKLQKHRGFAKQIDSGAGIFRYYYDEMYKQDWIKQRGGNYIIDNKKINPSSNATGFLYSYTPHIEGNKNFWTIWHKWFDKTLPDGLLVKSPDSSLIYYIEQGKRRKIESMSVFNSYFNESDVKLIDSADFISIPEGRPLQYQNYSLLRSNNRTYLLVDGELLQFASAESLRALGFNPLEIEDVVEDDLKMFKIGSMITSASAYPTGAILRTRQNKELFFVKNGYRFPILHESLLKTNFKGEQPAIINDVALIDYIEGKPVLYKNGTVIGVRGDSKIYLISNGEKRHIEDESVFYSLGLSFKDVAWTSQELLDLHVDGELISL